MVLTRLSLRESSIIFSRYLLVHRVAFLDDPSAIIFRALRTSTRLPSPLSRETSMVQVDGWIWAYTMSYY